eukprot:TRINITY_DN34498_c0_g2_i1.p1 TRINITY_DN34498_c0_g2~~TRINITY_DN34498_c0_g2_i1.p1  ORF type:complete len:1008 (-),score=164.93 TRINITY_DN34498_c0_g2_i1:132-3155(-)
MCALVASTDIVPKDASRGLRLPLCLHLTSSIPPARAAAFREQALRQKRYVRVSDEQDGALHVLADFGLEELHELEKHRRRAIGLPFAERVLKDLSMLEKVHALPVFDIVFKEGTAICCSGLSPTARLRCVSLTRWLGARFSEEVGSDTQFVVASRVSLHPDCKYQSAIQRGLPVVRLAYLEAVWKAKALVDVAPYLVPPLCGLSVCFDPRQATIIQQWEPRVVAAGAVVVHMDRAEVLIVKDVFSQLYDEARKIRLQMAPPLWLERCLELKCCVPVVGKLEVQYPTSHSLLPSGGPCRTSSTSDRDGCAAVGEASAAAARAESGCALLGCVLCLMYLTPGPERDSAKASAWKCGAFTTLDPFDRAITHVLFKVSSTSSKGNSTVYVSVPPEEDRVCFLDISWLEACGRENRRCRESLYPKQKVIYNQACDAARLSLASPPEKPRAVAVTGTPAAMLALEAPVPLSLPALEVSSESGSVHHGHAVTEASALVPIATGAPVDAAVEAGASSDSGGRGCRGGGCQGFNPPMQSRFLGSMRREPPSSHGGVFAGMTVGLLGWQATDAELAMMLQIICSQGGTALHGDGVREATLDLKVDVCVCQGFGAPQFAVPRPPLLPLVTAQWVRACVADGVLHARSSYPHFEPGPGPLPIKEMANFAVRITALEVSGQSVRRRAQLHELVEILGARVAQQNCRIGDITHVVCVVPALLDRKLHESASKRNIPVVTVQWLLDCFSSNSRQSEEQYVIGNVSAFSAATNGRTDIVPLSAPLAGFHLSGAVQGSSTCVGGGVGGGVGVMVSVGTQPAVTAQHSFGAAVMAGHTVLISPAALGSDGQLPQLVEELGATVTTWRDADELKTLILRHSAAIEAVEAGQGWRHLIVLMDKEEACGVDENGGLDSCIQLVPVVDRPAVFVLPSWLHETSRQRRRLPSEAFSALPPPPNIEPEASAKKKPRLDEEGVYGWESEASTRLLELAKDSRTREMQTKAQQKVSEGLRRAELWREPSRLVE